ncbi:MAG: phage/plasmid primase, P4 family [Alphaproteobacteria bacterium]|nr:phage/plasmid primase, P4 family [Alphaproteobacteria bacterium]
MDEFFKGYILTKEKRSTETLRNRTHFKKYDDVKDAPEFAGVLAENAILIDIDDHEASEILFDIVKGENLKCRVYETTRGKHFLFKNNGRVERNKTGCTLAVCLPSDIKLGKRNSIEILKYNNVERKILYDSDEYEDVPKFLTPIKTRAEFVNLGEHDGRNQGLFNYILTLQSYDFSVDESRQCIRIINKYILKDPLKESELETILRDESFQQPVFYKGTTFLFDKFATFLKNNHHIIKINGQLHIYKDGIYVEGQTEIEQAMIKHIPNLNRSKRSEVMAYLELLVSENTVPASANYIAFKNGILNIMDDSFNQYSPDFVITNKINWCYNLAARAELVDNTLNKMAVQDPQIRALLEECIGYCFYKRNELRKCFILTGDKSNGKSTFLDMVKTILGDENTCALDLKELGDRFKTAELFGKLANIGDDIGDEFIANPAIFKKLVTGDRINVERKGKDPFDFNNYAKFLFSANNIPRIKDKTGAVLDRLTIIPFNATFTKDDPDYRPYIKYDLRKEECVEYLIKLGILGLKRVLKNRSFTKSERVQKEMEVYEETNNPIVGFFKECGIDEIENQPTKIVFEKYQSYCLINNLQAMSRIEFSRQITKHFDFEIVNKKIMGEKQRVFAKRK